MQWAEWNDHFRDTVRDFWRGRRRRPRSLGYRLSGSQDLYGGNRRPWASVNFVTAHDGFTLRDLVSYDRKHNEANGEGNRDGTDNNRSANNGVEGETDDPQIRERAARQARNIMATLVLATGTPMITMGDELWRTQNGNNNAYCQTDHTVWLNWAAVDDDPDAAACWRSPAAPWRYGLKPRRCTRASSSRAGRSPDDDAGPGLVQPVRCADDRPRLVRRRSPTLLMWVNGRDVRGHGPAGQPLTDDSWLLLLHSGDRPVEVTLPSGPYGEAYTPVVDTAFPTGVPADPAPLSGGVG